ncbi:MAG: PD-(D/E)XK nuclease family transposase, partial [Methylomonas sp.]|nr:PD-(D/E)XK nuclease family transposase [Methylomonas sp.]
VFELHYVELRKFDKTYGEIHSALDRWSAFLTKAHQLSNNAIPEELSQDPAIVKAISAVDRMFDEEERVIYEVRMQSLADVESKIASALEKGLEQGLERGLEKGREQGREQEKMAIACSLLNLLDDDVIAAKTGLTLEAVRQLRNERHPKA